MPLEVGEQSGKIYQGREVPKAQTVCVGMAERGAKNAG